MFHGAGVYVLPNGDTYTGAYRDGLPDGDGVAAWANGNVYAGEFSGGVRSGHGRLSHGDRSYEGAWAGNEMHGEGVQTDPTGTFTGAWHEGERRGHGTARFGGNTYAGEWSCNTWHGRGSYADASGYAFVGTFHRGRPTEGLLTEADGSAFAVTYPAGCTSIVERPFPKTRTRAGAAGGARRVPPTTADYENIFGPSAGGGSAAGAGGGDRCVSPTTTVLGPNTSMLVDTFVVCMKRLVEFEDTDTARTAAMKVLVAENEKLKTMNTVLVAENVDLERRIDNLIGAPKPEGHVYCAWHMCVEAGILRCGACRDHALKYCSRACQKLHWSEHRTECAGRADSSVSSDDS